MIVWITLWCCRCKKTFKIYNGGGECIRMILKNTSCSYYCTSVESEGRERERRERGREKGEREGKERERESVSSSRQQNNNKQNKQTNKQTNNKQTTTNKQQTNKQTTHLSNKSALSNTERTIADFDFTHVVASRKKSSTKYGNERIVSMEVKYLVLV